MLPSSAREGAEFLVICAASRDSRAVREPAGRRRPSAGVLRRSAWPRLYPVLGEQAKSLVDDRRDALDAAVRMTATTAVTAIASLGLLARSGWWILLTLLPLGVAILAYNAAVQAALAYAESVHVAFDPHRADLLTALRMDLPRRQDTERTLNEQWCDLWRQGIPLSSALEYSGSPPRSWSGRAPSATAAWS